MKFYTVSHQYLEYLQSIDPRVPNHSGANYKNEKPFVGVIFTINTHKFIAPLTSPKGLPSKDHPTFFKITENNENESLGSIRISNMIPVLDSEIKEIIFNDIPDEKYKLLIMKQNVIIKKNESIIKSKANKLYNICDINPENRYKDRCCDFNLLISKYRNYSAFLLQKDQEEKGDSSVS
ncbi:type III toxin-antitoxin system ToxN/AbiQ family toxin [Acetobacter malorum]|nr:type III toxin-antitoxin system ToxN/AbiQ family toxin [Acetobacter malorum]